MTIGKLKRVKTLIPNITELFLEYILCKPYTRAKNLSSVHEPAYSFLPEDILINILARLPVKSVLRCRCVCKTWHQIIATPSFAKTHLTYQKASSSTNKCTLYYDNNLCSLFTNSDPLFDSSKHSKLYYTPELFGRDFTCETRKLEIYGACNGLLCLSDPSYHIGNTIHLWNPICRKAKKLPRLDISIKDEHGCNLHAGVIFGHYGDDYKVVVIACVNNTFIVSVYSLITNSWNIIQTNSDVFYFGFILATKFVDGTAYVLTSDRLVVCYNLGNQTNRVIKLPGEFCALRIALEVYGETIALLGHENNHVKNHFTMWILLRDESSSSPWKNKLSIKLKEDIDHQAVGFLSNGQYLVRTFILDGDLCVTKLFCCDLEDPKLTEIRSFTEPVSRFRHPPKYPTVQGRITSDVVESLVLLNEDSLHPFLQMRRDSLSTCSTLFTLQWTLTE